MLRVAIWGCGGISAMHRRGYQMLQEQGVPVEVVALCDINPSNFNNEIKINISKSSDAPLKRIDHCYTDVDEMIAKENLDLIDICLPTFLHKDATIKALDSGINVLVEKPMAMTSEEAKEMLAAEKRSGKRLMVGHCVRFNKAYSAMREAIQSGEYGHLISADFARLSAVPLWRMDKGGPNKGRLDGVILDMHIHDVDYVQGVFGLPEAISAIASKNNFTYCDSVSTTFKYEDAFVHIRGDWGLPQSFVFNAPFRVNLEKAAFVGADDGDLVLHQDAGGSKVICQQDGKSSIMYQIEYYVDILLHDKENTINPPEQSMDTIRLVEIIEASAKRNGRTLFLQ